MIRFALPFLAMFLALDAHAADPDGPIGTTRQPIVAGDDVSLAQQEELGLVRVGDDCSGALLNQYWVLTADHCITGGAIGGTAVAPTSFRITAKWREGGVTPTRVVRFWPGDRLDVALLFLGDKNFGSRERKVSLIDHGGVDPSMTLVKFGRGICAYAYGEGDDAVPARRSCGYRLMYFQPTAANSRSIDFEPNKTGQMFAGGDSGGPDYVTDGYGKPLRIAGVSSTCRWTVVEGKPFGWEWVNGVTDCSSVALTTIRDNIIYLTKEVPGVAVAIEPPRDDKIYQSRDKPAVTKSKSPYIGAE